MIDPTRKRQLSAMEELQAIARGHDAWRSAFLASRRINLDAYFGDFAVWELEMSDSDIVRYWEGE